MVHIQSANSLIAQAVTQEGKKLCVLHDLGNKTQLGVCIPAKSPEFVMSLLI